MTAPIWRPLDQLQRQSHGCYPSELFLDRSLVSRFLTLWDRTSMHQMSLLYALMSCERSSRKHCRSTPEKRPVVIGFVHPVDRTRETLRRNDLALVRKQEWRRGSRVVPGEIKLQKLASWFLLGEFRTLIPTRESQSSLNPRILLWQTAAIRHFRTRYVCFSVSMSVSVWYYRSSSVCLNVSVTVSVMLQIIIRVSVMLQILISMTECQCQCDVTDPHQSDWMSVSMSVSMWCHRSLSVLLSISDSVMLQIIISLTECHCQCQCQCDVTDPHQSDWILSQSYRPVMFSVPCCLHPSHDSVSCPFEVV